MINLLIFKIVTFKHKKKLLSTYHVFGNTVMMQCDKPHLGAKKHKATFISFKRNLENQVIKL